MSGGFCCCGGGNADEHESIGKPNGAATLGRTDQKLKNVAAPAGHAGTSPPSSPLMSKDSLASPVGSDGDFDEFFDARESLDTLRGGKTGRDLEDALNAEGIVLEERITTGIGRCVIPRRDIPFDQPGMGEAVSWSANPTGRGFKLRGKNYMKDRQKYPSETPLFDVVQVLAFRSDAKRLDFGDLLFGGNIGEMIYGCPTVYIVNLMLPDYPPPNPVWGKHDRVMGPDGQGSHIIVVTRMTAETRAKLEKSGGDVAKMPPEVALMARHFRANREADAETGMDAPPHSEASRQCTKMVCMVAAGQEELPWAVRVAIGQGNGKPFMVNKTGFFTKREDKGYFEIGVNVHNFGNLALNGLRNCHKYFKSLTLDLGVTLQGDSEDELPERLMFAFRAVKPDLEEIVVHIDEVDEEARSRGGEKGPKARPWLDWGALKMP